LAEQDKDLAGSTGQHEHVAEQAAGPSSGTAHDAAVYPGMAVQPHGRAGRLRENTKSTRWTRSASDEVG
jgi:hypothetical protein